MLSALGAALVGVAVASRTLYALACDRILASALATVSHQTGTPVGAVTANMALTFALLLSFGVAGTGALDAFFYLAMIGALSLLMAYVLVSVSAQRLHMHGRDKRRLPAAVLPLGGAVAALYVLYRNLIPAPAFPYSLLPYLVGGWLVLGLTVAAAMPQLRRRVSDGLA